MIRADVLCSLRRDEWIAAIPSALPEFTAGRRRDAYNPTTVIPFDSFPMLPGPPYPLCDSTSLGNCATCSYFSLSQALLTVDRPLNIYL